MNYENVKVEEKLYETLYVDGVAHNFSTVLWDKESKNVRYCIGSFYSRQLLDQCLSIFQKGTSLRTDGEFLYTITKGYTAKVARATDENKCDGVHAIFFNNADRVIRVYENENEIDKVYDWLTSNTKSGLIPEWKDFLYDELMAQDLIHECIGFDYTGKAPKVLVLDAELNDSDKATELIRNIKSYGLKKGYIKLPVEKNEDLPLDMSFLDIIQNLILPYIKDQDCHYNIGEPISPILQSPIVSGNKKFALYPRQQVMAQGLLNGIKAGLPYVILRGGMGVGKTYTGVKLAWALMQEHLKKDTGKISITLPSHLINKWQREVKDCLNPLGIFPNFIVINNYKDVKKVPIKSTGLDVIIFPKDRIKRNYLLEHLEDNKFKALHTNKVFSSLSALKKSIDASKPIIITELNNTRIMKYAALTMEKEYEKKVVLYMPYHNDGEIQGYYITTTSKKLKSILSNFKTNNKAYDIKFDGTLEELNLIIDNNISEIINEDIYEGGNVPINPTVCPHCGGAIFDKSDDIFDEDKHKLYHRFRNDKLTSSNAKCTSYVKADGTPLTNQEIDYIRRGITHYKVVEEKLDYAYVDENGDSITGEKLNKVKRNPKDITILLKVCGEKLIGAKNQTGYRCVESTKYMLKRLGKGGIDVNLIDEFHMYANCSNQGESFANICRLGRINIPMTGSLTSGKASDLFKLIFRLCPSKMIELGYGYNDESIFIDHFGRKKQEVVTYDENISKSGVKINRKPWKEIPGISPMLFNIILANHMVSRDITDLNIPLPDIKYYKHAIEMSDELRDNYDSLKGQFISFLKANKGVSIGGSYINGLISYPDMPQQKEITTKLNGIETLVAKPPYMELEDELLPKEQKLIDTLYKEIGEGRRVLVYATFTGEKGVSKRLVDVISKHFKVAELKGSKVKLENREAWIEEQYKKGTMVIITNPECVATGLNIIQYPSIYFYEIPLNTKTLRQAERRSFRPNATHDVRIYYSFYKNSIQEDIILLQSQKKRASLALEGYFSNDMLSIMSGEGSDSIEAMLNKVLEGKIKLKESELDAFGFDEEEVSFTFNNNEEGNVDITKTVTGKTTITVTQEEAEEFTLFTANEDFRKSFKKKKAAPVEGQLGFLFDL